MLLLSPLLITRHDPTVTLTSYLQMCAGPLTMMLVFYINYFWLTPRMFVRGKHRYFLLINFVLVVTLGILLHKYVTIVTNSPDHLLGNMIYYILRDTFTLIVSAAVATSLVLAMRWQRNEEARLEAEAARSEAELRNLRSQINPHFLLNTLNNIYALTAFDTERAQESIMQLSRLLRHMLYDNQESTVSIKDEIHFLQDYVNLMKIRLLDTVDVTFEVSCDSSDIRIAPLLFISLIENAFKHGISPTEPSYIHIRIKATEEQIFFDIVNSYHPKTSKDHSGHGIGLQQVQRRLDLAYPDRYEWEKTLNEDATEYRSTITIQL